MISIGDAMLNLGINTKDMDNSLKSIGGKINSSFGKLNDALGGLLPAISVAAVVAGYEKMMVSAAAYGEEVGLAATKTGLSVNLLQGLKFAADTSGASMDALTVGVKKMSTVLAEAFAGNSAAAQSIEELGLSVEDLRKMNPDQRIMAIFTALSKIEDPAIKSAAAVKMLGKSGTDLIPLINDVDQLVARFNKLHIALTEEDIKSLQDGKTAMEEMAISWELLQAKLGATMWPEFKPLLDELTSGISLVSQLIAAFNSLPTDLKTLLSINPVSILSGQFLFKQLGAIEKHAEGGIVTSPQIGMIGEAGPEAIIPLSKMGNIEDALNFARMPVSAHGEDASPGVIEIHSHLHLDGRQIAESVDRALYNRLNASGVRNYS